jgi:TonB-linked SusC/RagA family outer membrane protein
MYLKIKHVVHANTHAKTSLWQNRSLLIIGLILSAILFHPVYAQNSGKIKITGYVRDSAGIPVPQVTVTEKSTNNRSLTGGDGSFSINVANAAAVLQFSSVGYAPQEVLLSGRTNLNVSLHLQNSSLGEVVVVGYGSKKKESITGAISSITANDIDHVHGGSTVSSGLAGKLPGVSFRMPDGRPGSSANISIRNMGNPLYIIDGIQQDAGQFNNLAPNDIESISILKDASAAIYGVQAANGVVVVTTKKGRVGSGNSINVDAYYGFQNWTRFPKAVNSYEWQLGKVAAEMNRVNPGTSMTKAELERWKAGTEYGYRDFNWYDFIIQKNSPISSINVNATGGSDKLNYYLSLTRLDQNSVLGREFTFERTNLQSNIDAKVTNRLKVGVQINGRIETRDNPGVPGGDDYWAPRFALLRNLPFERPFANDNPAYLNDIGHNAENWGLLNKAKSGYWHEDWRVLQTNFTADYQFPVNGLTARGMYSYYIADRVMNGHEYTYDAYRFNPVDSTYTRTGGSTNPWRERGTHKVFNKVIQGQLNYNNTFGDHSVGGLFVVERRDRNETDVWVHAVPKTNALPLLYFSDVDTYNDNDWEEARVGYIGRINYGFRNKYYVEASARRDASWKFAPGKRTGTFPSISAGWRITQENFFKKLVSSGLLSELKLRASYGELGDDDVPIGAFDYISGYNYNSGSNSVFDGNLVVGSRYRGVPTTNISWLTSTMLDIGADFTLLKGKLTGSVDYYRRKRTGLVGDKYDVLVPSELGYSLPRENVNSDANMGGEIALNYMNKVGEFRYSVGGNFSLSRSKFLEGYKLTYGNSLDHYRNGIEDRWNGIYWGYEAIGQFQSQEEINHYAVNIDGQNNQTLLPGDLIYKDQNNDGKIDWYDERPIGYTGGNSNINFGLSISLGYKGFDFTADFSGASLYTFTRNWETRWPYQNGGNLLKNFYEDSWHREDPWDVNSKWIPGTYPALRFNEGGHSNYNKQSTFWTENLTYLRARTIELGYALPKSLLERVKIKKTRVYVNAYNLFSIDNAYKYGLDPEIVDANGLQYPQNKVINFGVNLSL